MFIKNLATLTMLVAALVTSATPWAKRGSAVRNRYRGWPLCIWHIYIRHLTRSFCIVSFFCVRVFFIWNNFCFFITRKVWVNVVVCYYVSTKLLVEIIGKPRWVIINIIVLETNGRCSPWAYVTDVVTWLHSFKNLFKGVTFTDDLRVIDVQTRPKRL